MPGQWPQSIGSGLQSMPLSANSIITVGLVQGASTSHPVSYGRSRPGTVVATSNHYEVKY